MSNNPKNNKELEIDEDKAYLELCQIIAEAIQTQDIELLQARITEWKRKYPYQKFSKNLKAKIDYLLNQYYSEIINQILATIKKNEQKKEFNQRKALVKLYSIIKSTNDIKDLNKKVDSWKKEFPVDDFMDMYKKRALKLSSKKNLEDNAFDTDKAYYDLYYLLKTNANFEELKERVSIWEKNYSIGDKFSQDDFKKHTNEVKQFLDEEYLYSIAKEDEKEDTLERRENSIAIQTESYNQFIKILKTGDMAKAVEWIYKNRNISFGKFYKEQIISHTAFEFPLSNLKHIKPKLNLNERGLSFEEYKGMETSRKYLITMFIESLMKDKKMDETTFQVAFNKSEFARFYNKSKKEKVENSEIKSKLSERNDSNLTIVLNIDEDSNKNNIENINVNNNSISITELEPEQGLMQVSEDNGKSIKDSDYVTQNGEVYESENSIEQSSYIIVSPDLLKVITEKSIIAEEMSGDSQKDKSKELDILTIRDVDTYVSEQVNLEKEPEQEFLINSL